ncbi:MAG: ribonuclease P protein component 4 [Nanobdellota archaeon]
MAKPQDKKEQKSIALKRIRKLMSYALERGNDKLGKRYVELSRTLARKYNLSFPKDLKRFFCNSCGAVMIPARSCRVRFRKHNVVYTCLECRNMMRYRYKF